MPFSCSWHGDSGTLVGFSLRSFDQNLMIDFLVVLSPSFPGLDLHICIILYVRNFFREIASRSWSWMVARAKRIRRIQCRKRKKQRLMGNCWICSFDLYHLCHLYPSKFKSWTLLQVIQTMWNLLNVRRTYRYSLNCSLLYHYRIRSLYV